MFSQQWILFARDFIFGLCVVVLHRYVRLSLSARIALLFNYGVVFFSHNKSASTAAVETISRVKLFFSTSHKDMSWNEAENNSLSYIFPS